MRLDEVNKTAVADTIQALGSTFRTKDVSEHDIMQQAHGVLVSVDYYHSRIGRHLSIYRDDLRIDLADDRKTERGVKWSKREQ